MSSATPDESWITVVPAGDIPAGEVRTVIADDVSIAVANVDGELHAIAGLCPHRFGPLGQGRLRGAQLSCPWHGFAFDVCTGNSVMPDGTFTVQTYDVRVVGGQTEVRRRQS